MFKAANPYFHINNRANYCVCERYCLHSTEISQLSTDPFSVFQPHNLTVLVHSPCSHQPGFQPQQAFHMSFFFLIFYSALLTSLKWLWLSWKKGDVTYFRISKYLSRNVMTDGGLFANVARPLLIKCDNTTPIEGKIKEIRLLLK